MTLRSVWRATKDEVVAENGMVVSKHPLAAEAGLEMLKRGGNAVDAAVAIGFAISVVEPMMTCIAGVGYMVVHLARQGKDLVIEYPPRAPRKARPDMYRVLDRPATSLSIFDVEGDENVDGYRSIAVPGTVAGLCLAHRLYGTLPLEQVMEPAIHYAAAGFEVNWYLSLFVGNVMDTLQQYPAASEIFLPLGCPPKHSPKPADKLVQRDLAEVLRRVARNGAAGFYTGEVAAAIEEDMLRNGGLVTREDLAEYRAAVTEPTRTTYRGCEVLAPAGANGAFTLVETLNILESFDLRALGHNSPQYLHLFIEAARHAYADRYHYLGDPEVVDVPARGLLSKAYAADLARSVDGQRARLEAAGDAEPWAYYSTRPLHDPWRYEGRPRPAADFLPSAASDGDCTTHFGVVDKERNLVSCTQTAVSAFGSKVVTRGLGVLWNNGMVWFNPKPGAANSIAPWKRPLVNMAPLIVKRDGAPYLSIGAPGGRRIINCNTQVLLNVLDFGMGIQEAIAQPRVDVSTRQTLVDARIDAAVAQALAERGHSVSVVEETPGDVNFATPLGILVDQAGGRVHGGVDVFRIAEARGY
ncbi:MAG: gamma-glutamyltransferase [Chloroflexi bacterium]|nr:gamma-glutamyltransferase [Chloroflexota bacterium]